MSVNQNSVKALIKVIESYSNLISSEDWIELDTLNSTLPEDEEEAEEVLENWLRHPSRSQIFQAYTQELDFITADSDLNLGGHFLGIGGSKSPTSPNQPSQPSKELIDNAIKRNSPLSDNKKSH